MPRTTDRSWGRSPKVRDSSHGGGGYPCPPRLQNVEGGSMDMPEGLTLPEVGVMMVVDLRYRIHPRLGMLQTAFIPHIAQKMDPSDIPDDAKEALKAQDAYALDAGVVGLEIVNWRKLVDGRGGDPLADLDPNICVWSMN